MTLGGRAGADVRLRRRHFGLQGQRRRQPRDRLGRPRPTAPTSPAPRPASRPRARASGRVYDQMFVRHWDTWAEPGMKSRIFTFPVVGGKLGTRRARHRPAGRRHAVQAVRRRRGDRASRPTAARSISRCARRGGSSRPRPISTSSRPPPTDRARRSTSPPPMTAPTRCRPCRPTAAPWPTSRWRAPAMRPTARW